MKRLVVICLLSILSIAELVNCKLSILPERPTELTLQTMHAELQCCNVAHADIVLAQAVLETGWFASNVCKTYNNCFGIMSWQTYDYAKFDKWQDSVIAYRDRVQYKYDSSKHDDYYAFLTDIGYAEDPDYIVKLKQVVKSVHKRL